MPEVPATGERPRVAVVGGGIAGITALMALADLGEGLVDVELIAPAEHFVLRPQLIGAPWGGRPVRVGLAELAGRFGATFRRGAVDLIHPDPVTAHLSDGERHCYDAMLIAIGAAPGVAYAGVRTVGFGALPEYLASSRRGSLAVVVPPGIGWTLPAYQLALMAATSSSAAVTVITPEHRPLGVFGAPAARDVAAFLDAHGVAIELSRTVTTSDNEAYELAEHVVSLPLLRGPLLPVLPSVHDGFIPVDRAQRVRGMQRVWAAGDVTAEHIKQGGLAAAGAERAVSAILGALGQDVPPAADEPVLRGRLTAGDRDLYLRRTLDAVDPGCASDEPLWAPPSAMLAWRLSRWLVANHGAGEDPLGPVARPAVRT